MFKETNGCLILVSVVCPGCVSTSNSLTILILNLGKKSLRWVYIPDRFSAIYVKGDNSCHFLFDFLQNTVHLTLLTMKKVFSLKADCRWQGRQETLTEVPPLQVYPFCLGVMWDNINTALNQATLNSFIPHHTIFITLLLGSKSRNHASYPTTLYPNKNV